MELSNVIYVQLQFHEHIYVQPIQYLLFNLQIQQPNENPIALSKF